MKTEQSLKNWGEYIYKKATELKEKVQRLLTQILLSKHNCHQCDGRLKLIGDRLAECINCHIRFDPTLEFQKCLICGEKLVKKTQYYYCPECQTPQRSIFSLDNWFYFPEYFAEKMKESRKAKRQKIEAMKKLLASARSSNYVSNQFDLNSILGLNATLNNFIHSISFKQFDAKEIKKAKFDLNQYRNHILDILPEDCTIQFDGISSLIPDNKLDRTFRFITLIYMWHYGEIILTQIDNLIKVERI